MHIKTPAEYPVGEKKGDDQTAVFFHKTSAANLWLLASRM